MPQSSLLGEEGGQVCDYNFRVSSSWRLRKLLVLQRHHRQDHHLPQSDIRVHLIHSKSERSSLLKIQQNMSTESSSGKFAPKQAVQLNPPKDDPISVEHLAKCDGMP